MLESASGLLSLKGRLCLRRQLALCGQMNTQSENDPSVVLQELENAKSVYSSGNFAAAEPALREVFEKLFNHPEGLSFCSEALSEIYTAWGKFSEAIKINQRFINVNAPNPNRHIVAIGAALERIAAVSLKVGKQEQSEKLYKLAQSVKAGKVDVTTLVTDKAKVPGAPPTTEHTYTFKALGPDSPAPPGMEASGTQPVQYQAPPQQPPVSPAVPWSPDALARPTKETASFSMPSVPNTQPGAPAVSPAMPQVPPGSPGAPTPPAVPSAAPGAPHALNMPQPKMADYELADFDEAVPVDPSQLSGTHATIRSSTQENPVVMPAPGSWGPGDAADFADFDEAVPVDPSQLSGAHAVVKPVQPGGPTPPGFAQPPNPAPAAARPSSDVLARPIKETAMFSRPNVPDSADAATPAAPQGAPPVAQQSEAENQEQSGWGDAPSDEQGGWGPAQDEGGWGPADYEPAAPVVSSPGDANQVSGSQPVVPPVPPAPSLPPTPSASSTTPQVSLTADAWGPRDHLDMPPSSPNTGGAPFSQFMSPSAQPPAPSMGVPASLPGYQSEPSHASLSNAEMAQAAFPGADQSQDSVSDYSEAEAVSQPPPNAASSARSIRSMSSRSMEAPPVSSGNEQGGFVGLIMALFMGKRDSDQPVQQIEDASVTSAKAAGVLVLLTAVTVGSFNCLYTVIPRKTNAEKAFLSSQHRYISGDSAKTFTLIDPGTCEFGIGDRKFRPRLKFYLDDWHDAVDLAVGKALQKQFAMYRTDDGIMDDEGSKVYLYGGPEIQLANKVEIVTQYAGLCFTRTKKYPDRGDVISVADLHYQNPYTKQSEVPSFHRVVVGKGASVSIDADEARTKFYDQLLSGELPKDTPEAHPGEMRCYAVDFLSPRGNTQGFAIQLIGKDGKPIYGARPHTRYLKALEEGKEYKPTGDPELPYKGEEGLKPVVVWLMTDKLDPNFMLFLTMAPVIIFTIFSFVFLVLAFIIPRGLGRAVAWLLVVGNAVPALLFCMSKMNL